jgi:hypothetical protein
MKQFQSATDLQQLPPDDPTFPIVADLVQRLIVNYEADGFTYDPDADGWIVLIEEGDTERILDEIWDDWTLLDVPWEGITREGDFFIAVFLANNEFGLVFVIPDADWVNGQLRDVIEENLDAPVEMRKTRDLI